MTQLCAIPDCRIRGRHLPGCEDDRCGGCLPRSTTDGLVCDVCTGSAGGRLAEIIQLTPDARLVAAGLVRRGAGGGSGGKPGSRSPANDDAMDVLDEIQNALTTIARDIAETRGFQTPSAGLGVADPISWAAKWLSGQMAWLRGAVDDQGGPYAAVVFAEIADCASKMRWLVNGPTGDQRYLGPCGAVLKFERCWSRSDGMCLSMTDGSARCDEGECVSAPRADCDGDVYVRGDGRTGRCKTCGAEVDRGDREAWLDGEVRGWAFRASEIAEAYRVSVDTIRSWAFRGHLKSYCRTETGIVAPWNDVAAGAKAERLHYVGDVLDLAAADAARREENRAKRARRMEQRSGEEAA